MALTEYKKRAVSVAPENSSVREINRKGNITQSTKKRNWAFVAYPESAPADLFERLQKTGLQVAVSPLHDKDVEADGKTPKKPHWHIILVYAGPTSYDVVKKLTDSYNAPKPIALEGVRGYYRYFTHKDNPEKFQYDEKDIKCLNGFSILDFVELAKSEVLKIMKELQKLIIEKKMVEYADFMDYMLVSEDDAHYDVASSHTFFFDKYLTSRRHKNETVKPKNGETLAEEALGGGDDGND